LRICYPIRSISAQIDNRIENGILEEFRIEFLECWRKVPNKGFFLVLLAAWLILFQFLGNSTLGYTHTPSLMTWMYIAYHPIPQPGQEDALSEDGHGLIVPLVVLGLFWWKRKALVAEGLDTWWPGLLIVAFGLLTHIAGYMGQQPKLSVIGLFIGIYGLTGLAWGPVWLKKSFFPFVLFAFCVPLASQALPITFKLRMMVSQIVEAISHNLLAIDVIREGTSLKDPSGRYSYDVAAPCSGIRSLVATVGFALVYGVVSFRSWWKRVLLIASAFPLAVAGNALRMLTIVIAADIGGQERGNYVHEGGPGGIISLLPYIPAFVGLLALGHWLEKKYAEPKPVVQPAQEAQPA